MERHEKARGSPVLPTLLSGTQEEEGGWEWDVTFRIPVMENLRCGPGGGQLFREFRCEPYALRVYLLEERLLIPLQGVPLGPGGPQPSQLAP